MIDDLEAFKDEMYFKEYFIRLSQSQLILKIALSTSLENKIS